MCGGLLRKDGYYGILSIALFILLKTINGFGEDEGVFVGVCGERVGEMVLEAEINYEETESS